MRKWYNEFFYIPRHGKIREKAMLTRVVTTVGVVMMCLAAMSITAYAYFSHSVTSGANLMQTANFETNVSIQMIEPHTETVDIESVDGRTQQAKLYAGNTYQVTIEKAGTANTGFCVITASDCAVENYHTQQLGEDVHSDTQGQDTITFTLTVTDTTVVQFYAHWGTSSSYGYVGDADHDHDRYILDGEEVAFSINSTATQPPEDQTPDDQGNTDGETESTPPAAENNAPPTDETTPSDTTNQTEPTDTTEPTTPETSAPTEQTEPVDPAQPASTEETQPAEQPTDTPAAEENGS